MIRQLHQLLHRTRHRWRGPAIQQPLLNRRELQDLQHFALTCFNSPLTARRDVQQQLLGDRLSRFSGSGYEFAENRLFQTGDDARFINWRLFARSGQLYRKVFHEERRPPLWLVLDRRGPMRFGTRTRLKITAAVRQALVYLYQAQQQQLAVGAVLLDQPEQWFDVSASGTSQQTLIDHMIAACPPPTSGDFSCDMDTIVRQLQNRLLPGSIVVLLSDFHDLQERHLAHLHHLSQQHSVMAVQVLDDIELQLPSHGRYRLANDAHINMVLDCNDHDSRQKIEQQLRGHQQQVEQWLLAAGLEYHCLLTSDEPFQLLPEPADAIT